ncbi:MAG: TAXI family TRAP transporter solute-binding subunit [Candidatus Hydrogenedentes bacterium]|nr:TAXI family TRAP transporter solute-binding subunit [Candidatus Hydrogenedentota bacterium]
MALLGAWLFLAPYQALTFLLPDGGRAYTGGGGKIVFAADMPESSAHAQAAVLAELLRANRGYTPELLETGGHAADLDRVRSGDASLAIVQGGLNDNLDDLAALTNLAPQFVHLAVPADSSVQILRDLAGKRVGVGLPGSGAGALAAAVFGYFSFSDPVTLVNEDSGSIEEAFSRGDIDAAFIIAGLFSPPVERLFQTGYFRLIPLPEAPALARFLPGTRPATLPEGLYGPDRRIPDATSAPIDTLMVNSLLLARSDAHPALVRDALEQVYSVDFQRAARLPEWSEASGRNVAELPLHPAAALFFDRNNPVSTERLAVLFCFALACLCLALLLFLARIAQQNALQAQRREAIRPYFKTLMDLGLQIQAASTPGERAELLQQMTTSQRQAEQKWLKGLLDTEDMRNLYAVHQLRLASAAAKFPGNLQDSQVSMAQQTELDWTHQDLSPKEERSFFMGEDFQRPARRWNAPQRPLSEEEIVTILDTEGSGAGEVRVRKHAPAPRMEMAPVEVDSDVPDDTSPDQMLLF